MSLRHLASFIGSGRMFTQLGDEAAHAVFLHTIWKIVLNMLFYILCI